MGIELVQGRDSVPQGEDTVIHGGNEEREAQLYVHECHCGQD